MKPITLAVGAALALVLGLAAGAGLATLARRPAPRTVESVAAADAGLDRGRESSGRPNRDAAGQTDGETDDPSDDPSDAIAPDFVPEQVRRRRCPASEFECVTITVPKDAFAPDPAADRWEVTYAVRPATGRRLGTFVTITGGPGTAGISSADTSLTYVSESITEHYDLVFLDQRGSGDHNYALRCDDAVADYYDPADLEDTTGARRDLTDDGVREEITERITTFVDDCLDESGVEPDDVVYYGTRYAAEDLEMVRRHLGADQLHLYGESYGTQLAQTYAAAHPDRVAALFLDGVVDLSVDGIDWYERTAHAYEDTLTATFASCADDEACLTDLDGADDVGSVFDELLAEVGRSPVELDFPLPDGTTERRRITRDDLLDIAGGNLATFTARMQLVRTALAAHGGNWVPAARMIERTWYRDPDTGQVYSDPSFSDALYVAVECQDYAFYPELGSPRERVDAWLDEYVARGLDELRLGTVMLADLACVAWPADPEASRPEPITDAPFPTFVMTADTDPATPVIDAMGVFSRLDDAYLVMLQNGPHVIFGWGFPCVDDLVTDFLADGTLPATRVTVCNAYLTDLYIPLAPDTDAELASLLDDPLATAGSIADQVAYSLGYVYWDGLDPIEVGCDFGGTVAYEPSDVGAAVALDGCEFTDGFPIDARGSIDWSTGATELTITVERGKLDFADDLETETVAGVWDGTAIDESRPAD